MKTVYLVRHGKAGDASPDGSDFERVLVERGIEDARTLGGRLAERLVRPSVIVSSTAPRALETAKIIARSFGIPVKRIRARKALYEQDENAIVDIIASCGPGDDSLVIVGHNPSIEESARVLVKKFDEGVPTCGCVAFYIEEWDAIGGEEQAKFLFFETPETSGKKLPKKELRKALEHRLADAVENALGDVDGDVYTEQAKKIRKMLAAVAGDFADDLAKKRKKERKAAAGAEKA